jgi:nucleoside-diphosphate-sugar epimerase
MRVFIAGATGVLGRRLVKQLTERGHAAVGLVRGEEGRRLIESLGGEACQGSLFDANSLAAAASGAQVVIHAATAIPTKPKTLPGDWEMNDRIRREGTRALVEAAARVGARLYLQQSVVWVARPEDESSFDEDTEPRPAPLYRAANDAERIAREAGARGGFKVAVLRCGGFYAADAGHTRALGRGLIDRKIPIIGKGDAVWAALHADDAAGAFVAATESGKEGLWHVTDDEPATVGDLLKEFARLLDAKPPRRAPAWLARLVAGRGAVEFFTKSTRTSNARFRRDIGWSPRYPSYRDGLKQIVAAWDEEGFAGSRAR